MHAKCEKGKRIFFAFSTTHIEFSRKKDYRHSKKSAIPPLFFISIWHKFFAFLKLSLFLKKIDAFGKKIKFPRAKKI